MFPEMGYDQTIPKHMQKAYTFRISITLTRLGFDESFISHHLWGTIHFVCSFEMHKNV